MKKSVTLFTALFIALPLMHCSSAPKKDPMLELKQLITLYEQDRPKFVVQKQNIIQESGCGRANRLRAAADTLASEAAMQPGDSSTIVKIQMEMQQAQKECEAR